MAIKLINDSILIDIANAIREKLGVTTTYKPSQMPDAINSIQAGTGGGEDRVVKVAYRITNGESITTSNISKEFAMFPHIPEGMTVAKIKLTCDGAGFTNFEGWPPISYVQAEFDENGDYIRTEEGWIQTIPVEVAGNAFFGSSWSEKEFYIGVVPGSLFELSFSFDFKKASPARNLVVVLECSEEINTHSSEVIARVPYIQMDDDIYTNNY